MASTSDDEANALRDTVLEGYAPKPKLAKAFERHVRTIDRWKVQLNVPSIRVGNEEWLSIDGLRQALTRQAVPAAVPVKRKRGRPRKIPASTT
jgi:hypothetical protein